MYHVAIREYRDALKQPMGRITLAHCATCDHVFNQSFDRDLLEYRVGYDNALHHSPRFASYMDDLAAELVQRLGIHGGTVLEIGCGQGDFLRLVCDKGESLGIGLDPSYSSGNDRSCHPRVRIIPKEYEPSLKGRADLVCARHVLEHIEEPAGFMGSLIDLMTADTAKIMIEVPNGLYIWRDNSIWDILYEHVSYFSEMSLRHLFRRSGLEALFVEERFGGQFIVALGRRAGPPVPTNGGRPTPTIGQSHDGVRQFAGGYGETIAFWRQWLRGAAEQSQRVYLWGAGTKSISFLNLVAGQDRALQRTITGVVDINPAKEGRFTPGTGHPILAPASLGDRRPDVILVMNPNYETEIRQMVHEILGEDHEKVEIRSIVGKGTSA